MEEEEILGHFCALNRKMSKNEKFFCSQSKHVI